MTLTDQSQPTPFVKQWFKWDALYDDAAVPVIKEKYPNLVVEDARDGFHPDRVRIELSGVTNGEFYKFAIKEGFSGVLLLFHVQIMRDSEFADEMVAYAKSLRDVK
jgi:hypothetical protein